MSEPHPTTVGPIMTFSAKRPEVVRFYRDIAGLTGEDGDHATWLDAENARLVAHDLGDEETPEEIQRAGGFVVWLGVADIAGAFERARRAGAAVGEFRGDYFFARDPDGRYVGIFTLEDGHGHDHEH